jgi:hypothetical protein
MGSKAASMTLTRGVKWTRQPRKAAKSFNALGSVSGRLKGSAAQGAGCLACGGARFARGQKHAQPRKPGRDERREALALTSCSVTHSRSVGVDAWIQTKRLSSIPASRRPAAPPYRPKFDCRGFGCWPMGRQPAHRLVVVLPEAQYGEWLDAPPERSTDCMMQLPADRLAMAAEPLPPRSSRRTWLVP